jgi:hypothetical protein
MSSSSHWHDLCCIFVTTFARIDIMDSLLLHSLSLLLPEHSLMIIVAATMRHFGVIKWELSRPPIMGNTHSSILRFVEESPGLGLAACSMHLFLWWCQTDDDGKSCSSGDGEKDSKRALESTNICRDGSLDILLLCSRLEKLELAWEKRWELFFNELIRKC